MTSRFNWGVLRLLLCAAAILPGIVSAQDPDTASGPEARYAIEIVVFENLDQSRTTAEFQAPQSGRDEMQPDASGLQYMQIPPALRRGDFVDLPASDYQLTGARNRLERLGAYRPLAHLAWTQPASGRADAIAFELPAEISSQTGLRGSVTLFKERFMHLAVDLEMAGNSGAKIQESRRLRGDQTQYFDHPRFGVIARVRLLDDSAGNTGS